MQNNVDKQVEELAEHLRLYYEHDKWGYFDRLAEYLISKGYIHKSKSLDYVELCTNKECNFGQAPKLVMGEIHYHDCPICQGKGIVLKESIQTSGYSTENPCWPQDLPIGEDQHWKPEDKCYGIDEINRRININIRQEESPETDIERARRIV